MGWQAKSQERPGFRALVGRHVRVEPLTWPEPGGRLTEALTQEDADLWTHMTIGPFTGPEALATYLQRANREDDKQVMGIFSPAGDPLGMAGFLRIRPDHGSAELGVVFFGRQLQGSRAGTEALFLMIGHLFDDLGWRRCEWICHGLNERSQRAAQRLGFTFEGIFRQDMWLKGRNRDTHWYSMLDTEWPERKAAFEAWAADRNFDEHGQQRRKLQSFRP